MKRTWVLGVVVAWTGLLSAAGQTPFERVAIDDSVKAPWAKIIAISEMYQGDDSSASGIRIDGREESATGFILTTIPVLDRPNQMFSVGQGASIRHFG